MADDFVTRMCGHINNSSEYYPIRRSFGQSLDTCQIEALISYSKLMEPETPRWEQEFEFLVAGLCYNAEKQGNKSSDKRVPFEKILRLLYINSSDSGKKTITKFLSMRYSNTAYFNKTFASLARRALPYAGNQRIDYYSLLKDLKNWNSNNTRMKWASTICCSVDNDVD